MTVLYEVKVDENNTDESTSSKASLEVTFPIYFEMPDSCDIIDSENGFVGVRLPNGKLAHEAIVEFYQELSSSFIELANQISVKHGFGGCDICDGEESFNYFPHDIHNMDNVISNNYINFYPEED
jgi:hypothetical protein